MLPNFKNQLQDSRPLALSIILSQDGSLPKPPWSLSSVLNIFKRWNSLVQFIVWHFSQSLPVFYLILIHTDTIKEDFFFFLVSIKDRGQWITFHMKQAIYHHSAGILMVNLCPWKPNSIPWKPNVILFGRLYSYLSMPAACTWHPLSSIYICVERYL